MEALKCEVCGITSEKRTSWNTWCPLHFEPICEKCCTKCKYYKKYGSLVHCSFKDKELK